MKFAIIPILPFLNNPKDLDPSYICKMDLDLWDCFGRKKLRLITEEIRYLNYNALNRTCSYIMTDMTSKNSQSCVNVNVGRNNVVT